MTRKRRSAGGGGGRTAKRRQRQRRRRRHLYLVFDDWLWGYSIRKIDLSSTDSDSEEEEDSRSAAAEQRLSPAVVRLEAPRGQCGYFAGAFGTKLLALHPKSDDPGLHPLVPKRLAPIFDVRSRGLIFGPRPKAIEEDLPIYIPIGGTRLFSLAAGSFQLLDPPPLDYPGGDSSVWSWCKLPKPPFSCYYVTSYAVHPDGRTIFVSNQAGTFTFTFDTKSESGLWKRHGDWVMPFTGRAYFDRELDAWVGLSGGLDDDDHPGHICACDVPASDDGQGCPSWKLSKEKLWSEVATEKGMGTTLLYMGRGKYCLVQCVGVIEDDGDKLTEERNYYYNKTEDDDDDEEEEEEEEDLPRPCRFSYRVSTFSLRYDKNGDLTTGGSHRHRVRYYKLPKASSSECFLDAPVAFWM